MDMPRRRLLDDDPPPIRRRPFRVIALLTAALVLGALMIVVVMNIDAEIEPSAANDEVIELIAPKPLSESDRAGGVELGAAMQPELARGGWVRLTDPETGELAQQYRCDRLDPNPEGFPQGWLRLEQPRMEIYLKDDRVVTLAGDSAVAFAPHRAIEMGTITGNVLLRLYENPPDRPVDTESDEPALVVTTDEASFESFLGEIRCDGWVRIETPRLQIPGKALSLLVDDQHDTVQLRIDRYDYIRLLSLPEDRPARDARRLSRARLASHVTATPASSTDVPAIRRLGRVSNRTIVQQDTPASGADPESQFYLLTLRENIRIDQGDPGQRKQARGDRLELVFSMESEGMDGALARATPAFARPGGRNDRDQPSMAPAGSWHAALASAMIAVAPPDSASIESLLGPDITIIRGDGPLTVEPLSETDDRRPPSAKDAVLELIGAPVVLCDVPGHAQATGNQIQYTSADDTVELTGSKTHPLLIDSPELQAGGERFWLRNRDALAGFAGAGWMVNRPRDSTIVAPLACAAPPIPARPASGRAARPEPAQGETPEIEITWDDGMELEFNEQAESDRGGRIKAATFTGNVRVRGDEFTLDAHHMRVGFPEDGQDETQIESIHAAGNVRVLGVGQTNSILCDELNLDLVQSSRDRTIPKLMVAIGNVHAIDEEQMIWSDRLRVQFREAPPSADQDAPDEPDESAARDRRRDVQVEELLAEDDVQVLLADGSRAFADRLVGDGIRETVVLTGEDVIVVSEGMIVDQGTRLEINRKAARTTGPGRLRIFENALLTTDRIRAARPAPEGEENSLQVYATWRESMHFDSTFNDGAGSIDFRGDVDVVSQLSPVERSTMTGDVLTLEFIYAEPSDEDEHTGANSIETSSPMDMQRGSRELSMLIARGDARIESHEWQTSGREEEPRIFYVAGRNVEYDNRTGEALAVGDVELLMHDPWPATEEASSKSAPFGSKGSSMLRCTRQVRLTPRMDNVDDILASGAVELRHRDQTGAVSWLTCDQLDASVIRSERPDERERAAERLDLGGSGALEQVRATGGTVIDHGQRRVQCESFDYDVPSAIARIVGGPGRLVTVETKGAPGVTRAEAVVWYLDRDVIQITRPAGMP